jgi:hypothetical protein
VGSFIGFWILALLLALLIVSGFVFLAYWIPKRFGKRKLGIVLSIIVTLIFLAPILSFVFEDYLFFKSDVIERLKEHNLTLQDSFDLESNKISGIRDYYQRFEIQISNSDKDRLIKKFTESPFYRDSIPEEFDFIIDKPRYSNMDEEFIVTYQDDNNYIYEYYKPNKQGYAPTWDKISISKDENQLIYERVLD